MVPRLGRFVSSRQDERKDAETDTTVQHGTLVEKMAGKK